jgi:superfamily II DNA helicase RecQ
MLNSHSQIVVEPLNALILSQINELSTRKVRVVKLLSRMDTPSSKTRPEDQYGLDYLWDLVVHYHNDTEPLIIFTTPELLSKCTEENGPIQALAEKKFLSLIVLDEFDYIDDCHQYYRNAYTTIISDLKRSVEHSRVPFLYLSATGSNCRMLDILFTISNPYSTLRPILVQTEQILPHNHIYRGTKCILVMSQL